MRIINLWEMKKKQKWKIMGKYFNVVLSFRSLKTLQLEVVKGPSTEGWQWCLGCGQKLKQFSHQDTSIFKIYFELTTSVVIGTDCIGSCKSKYHTITATKAPTRNGQLKKFLFLVTAAILNGGRGCRTQFWKGPTQGPLLKIEIYSNGQNCSILSQNVPKFELYKHNDEPFNIY
jgi:hypothetical protein